MGLVYDKDGESVLTHAEIADILGVDVNKLINTKIINGGHLNENRNCK